MSGFSDAFYRENTLKYMGQLFGADADADSKAMADGMADGDGDGDGDDDGADGDDDDGDNADEDDEGEGVGEGDSDGETGASGLRLDYAADGVETGERASYWFTPSEVRCLHSRGHRRTSTVGGARNWEIMGDCGGAYVEWKGGALIDLGTLSPRRVPTELRALRSWRRSIDPRTLPVRRQVWEIRGADITVSPVHKAAVGLVHPERGLSLRFPRFIRKRPDKGLRDATSPAQLAALYSKQASVAAHAGSAEAGGAA